MIFAADFITLLYLLDRLLRLAALWYFFRRPAPAPPTAWPSLSLIQPITTGAANLENNLRARFAQVYAGDFQHLLICDAGDPHSQAICQRVMMDYPTIEAEIVPAFVPGEPGAIASKIEKLNTGVQEATGEIYCFVDDDIELLPATLARLVSYLQQPKIGAVFGLPCAASWTTPWSSLMTLFVNSNALPTYVPLTYLSDPVAITGHLFAVRALDLQRAGSWAGMERRIDDDSHLGRQLMAAHLRLVQTPVIYRVHNEFATWSAYAAQIKRWFIFPRQTVMPYLSPRQQLLSSLLSMGVILPVLALLLTLFAPSWSTIRNLFVVGLCFWSELTVISIFYLHEHVPFKAWLLTLITLFVAPLQMVWALLFAAPVIQWRGQTLRIARGGESRRV